jgi:hypothetical protein
LGAVSSSIKLQALIPNISPPQGGNLVQNNSSNQDNVGKSIELSIVIAISKTRDAQGDSETGNTHPFLAQMGQTE